MKDTKCTHIYSLNRCKLIKNCINAMQTSFTKFDDVSLSELVWFTLGSKKPHQVFYSMEKTKLRLSLFELDAILDI